MSDKQPDAIDVQVGSILRARRKLAGLSQGALAEALGVTFQQVQKYERGANRISASMLVRAAKALDCEVAEMFPDGNAPSGTTPDLICVLAALPGGAELGRIYIGLNDHRREGLIKVARALVDEAAGEEPGHAYVTGGDERRVAHA